MTAKPELMAPAGSFEAGCAALQYGADAVYAGLPRFSARADAQNLDLDALGRLVTHAHALAPRRRVYVALNTLLQDHELAEVVDLLVGIDEAGVDAAIVQDMGVYQLLREHLPDLRLHASTQMAVHSAEGVAALAQLGFARATLARELTLKEIEAASRVPGIEAEVFVHGTLCYSYSGLCLLSSHLNGRSGNRGRCAYPCRRTCRLDNGEAGLFFSMKDLVLAEHIPALARAGVASVKIEGRKKSPLYVAATTALYRDLLDGVVTCTSLPTRLAELACIFSRQTTALHLSDGTLRDVVDLETTGHRGAPLGTVEAVSGRAFQLVPELAFERHDGLQIVLPGRQRLYGFAADSLHLVRGRRAVFEVAAGQAVEVELPEEHPRIPVGTAVFLASSQAVKRRYQVSCPRPGDVKPRQAVAVRVELTEAELTASVALHPGGGQATIVLDGPFSPARNPERMTAALERAFGSLGDSDFALARLDVDNPEQLFVPVSRLNQARRDLVDALTEVRAQARQARCEAIARTMTAVAPVAADAQPAAVNWQVKVDDLKCLSVFEAADWEDVEDVIVDLETVDDGALDAWRDHPMRPRLRLALPPVCRADRQALVAERVAQLCADGWVRWQVANPSGLSILQDAYDVTADWPLYTLNRLAARQWLDLGFGGFTLSPEDDADNLAALVREFPDQATVIVYQDTPLFLAANLTVPPGPLTLGDQRFEVVYRHGTLIMIHDTPFSLVPVLLTLRNAGARHLRADFLYRDYTADWTLSIWRQLRMGEAVPGRLGNARRGLADIHQETEKWESL